MKLTLKEKVVISTLFCLIIIDKSTQTFTNFSFSIFVLCSVLHILASFNHIYWRKCITQLVAIPCKLVCIKTIVLYRFCNKILWQIFH